MGAGRGIGAFTKTFIHACSVIDNNFQILCVPMNDLVQLCFLYLSRDCDQSTVVSAIDSIMKGPQICIFAGDFNFQAGTQNMISNFFTSMNYLQLIKSPTHEKGRIIDHLYAPNTLSNNITIKLHYPHYSDHAAILVRFE